MSLLSHLPRGLRVGLIVLLGIVVVAVSLHMGRMVLAPTRDASIDAVRVRNALVVDLGSAADVNWAPEAPPQDFNWERLAPPQRFVEVTEGVLQAAPADAGDFDKALLLARHIRENARGSGAIQANAWETYQRLRSGQGGYCSDYTQTMNALALAAGLKIREWGFAWETMANGHAFSEVWEPSLGKWLLLDSHHGFYVVDAASGVPLSVVEFRDHLMTDADPAAIRLLPISAAAFDAERVEAERAFYARGVPRMFLLMGNNVYSYDAHPLIQATEALPRSLEMLTGIALGEHPRFLFVPPADRPDLRAEVEAMTWTRTRTLLEVSAGALSGLGALALLWSLLPKAGARRRDAGSRARDRLA